MGEEYTQKSFTFWVSYFDVAFDLEDNERLAFYDTVLRYIFLSEDGEQKLKEDGYLNAYFAFKGIKANLKTSTSRSENGVKGGRPKKLTESKQKANGKLMESKPKANENLTESKTKANEKQNESKPKANEKLTESNIKVKVKVKDKEKEKDKEKGEAPARSAQPSVEEIREYCTERGNAVDPEAFFDFYESKGWKVGSQPMKDWRAAVRTWEKRTATPEQPKVRKETCPICGLEWKRKYNGSYYCYKCHKEF